MTEIVLLDHQIEFCETDQPFPAIVGGLGSGKTRAGQMRLIMLMLEDPGINTLYTMPTYDLLRLRAIPGFEEDLTALGLDFKTNKSEWSIYIHALDGYIFFRSYDNPERLVAFEVAHSIADELDTINREKAEIVWRKMSERTRQESKKPNSIGVVTTPDQGIAGFVYHKWAKLRQAGYQLIKASTKANYFLPKGYIDQIRANYDPTLVELYLEGEFVSLSANKVYHFFDRMTHYSDRVIKEADHLHIGLDFNVGGCVAIVSVYDSEYPTAVDEFVSHDTQDFINNLVGRYKGHTIIIYPDASGGNRSVNAPASSIAMLSDAGYSVESPARNPFVRDRINSVNGLLSHDKILINTTKCPELTMALEAQGYEKNGDPEKFNSHPAIDDYNDAFGYFINRRHPVRRPVTNIGIRFAI